MTRLTVTLTDSDSHNILTGTGTDTGKGAVTKHLNKARHEQFFECGTRVRVKMELHRKLVHPTGTISHCYHRF